MKPILEINRISKRYNIQHQGAPYKSVRDSLSQLFRSGTGKSEDFYALNDVSFDVYAGESIGIIGRNGAGKSTLLKILSKITPPSAGKITSRGRIASLLEVGTGFHPELTGRENIFLNASILGMKHKEVLGKFDEIVDFSGTERFLDTPLKHYSSGMQLRLAFAVAAFIEPEILVIDEVLAVGDMEFQKKCLGKMESVSKSGRTILFVSHQMGMINSLCEKSVLLDKGKIQMIGKSKDVILGYNELNLHENQQFELNHVPANKDIYITRASIRDSEGKNKSSFAFDEHLQLQLSFHIEHPQTNCVLGFNLRDQFGRVVFTSQIELDQQSIDLKKSGDVNAVIEFPENLLTPNHYSIIAAIHIPNVRIVDSIDNICAFTLLETGSPLAMYEGIDYGCVFANCNWKLEVGQESSQKKP